MNSTLQIANRRQSGEQLERQEYGIGYENLSHLDPPPPRNDDNFSSLSAKDKKKADYKTWTGNNVFFCGGKLVTGPNKEIVPSLILHAILFSVSLIWGFVAIPYLMSE